MTNFSRNTHKGSRASCKSASSSSRRKPVSRLFDVLWTPAFAWPTNIVGFAGAFPEAWMFSKIRSAVQAGTRLLGYVGMLFIFPMMLLTSADAFTRDFFSRPIKGAFEVSSLTLSVFVLLGLAYTQQMKDHVQVTILVDRLPGRWKEAITILTTLLSMFIVAILCWQGVVLAGENTSTVSDMLRIPQWPFRTLVAVGGFFLFLEFFFDLADSVRRIAE